MDDAIRHGSEGWYRRFEIVRFPNEFKKTDPGFDLNLETKLKEETPGIFNWAVEGLRRLKRNVKFNQANSIIQAKREYEIENDSVTHYIDENAEYDEDNYEICSEVYREYRYFCEQSGFIPVSKFKFTSRLKGLGFDTAVKWVNGRSQRCYLNITV